MIRLAIVVEGQTEEAFVNTVLVDSLSARGIYPYAAKVPTSVKKKVSGGVTTYGKLRNAIRSWLDRDRGSDFRLTTMVDFYRLPSRSPGVAEARKLSDPYAKVELIERRLAEDIDDSRFLPYVQLHEFEALILSDLDCLREHYLDDAPAIRGLQEDLSDFDNPELIDEGKLTAPSKRIIRRLPVFEKEKSRSGPVIARKIGLENLRARCRHFGEWVTKLEALAG